MQRLGKCYLFGAAAAMVLTAPASGQTGRCPVPPLAAGGPDNIHTGYVEGHLQPPVIKSGARPFSLADRMRQYDVPGISVAVIHDGKIVWARGWGVRDLTSCKPVTPNTAFQAASISKVVTAVTALRLVEQGRIKLDQNINEVLRSWKVPKDAKLAPNGITLRELLSHTAGLGVHGFGGYQPGAPLPTTVQILDGVSPANTPPVRSILPVGGQFEYSGGGYVVTQVALSDVSGTAFADLSRREVLAPLGMTQSAFTMPPSPTILANAAFGSAQGKPMPSNYQVYPELAPAGLWTTATDLARLLIDLQASAAGKGGHRLSPAMTRLMMTPVKDNWGLGVAVYPEGAPRFMHDGVNAGYESFMVSYIGKGDGIVALTNGGDGRRLMGEVIRAIATDYGWSDVAAPTTEEKTLSLAELSKAAGHFEGGDLKVDLEARSEGLFAKLVGGSMAERLIALSPTRFRSEGLGVTVEFAPDFSSCTMIEGAPPMKMIRSARPRSAS